uniref:DUF3299 domain-containing protein n=1 Tax=Ningiella ruwaisensis TaxID=2364274 RepID=UPI0010A07B6C|nr:DUF3299 domain-containing protein [Ningiella ruwaisensis]
MKAAIKAILLLIACIALGIGIGFAIFNNKGVLLQWFMFKPTLYETQNDALVKRFESSSMIQLEWSQLLPQEEKSILKKYQQNQAGTPKEFADNLLLSLQASTDEDYSSAMISTNSVDTFDNKPVSIAGFIVPIDYAEDKSLSNIFIVPYFGACLHFPPPPPNQIIFAQLGAGFTDFELTQAYRLRGVLRRGLFEDPLGTSAYILDVVSIEPYYENPDDFRQH